jgi:large subunit ribosomal protein L28e
VFSRESNNLYNVNSQKFSGLIGKKSIGVSAGAGNKGVVVRVFKKKAAHQPAKSVASFVIARPSVRRAAKTVKGLAKNHYRSSLQKVRHFFAITLFQSMGPIVFWLLLFKEKMYE